MKPTNHDCRMQSVPREARKKKQQPCPGCLTNPRSAASVFCGPCWRSAPKALRNLFAKPKHRREAIRAIIDHYTRERQEPRLRGF